MSEQRLPTPDEFFGPADQALNTPIEGQTPAMPSAAPATPAVPQLPTPDEFFAPTAMEAGTQAFIQGWKTVGQTAGRALGMEIPPSSPQQDDIFNKSVYGRVLRGFGQGLEQGWGDGPVSFGNDTNNWLRKVGIYNDFRQGQQNLTKAFNEAWIRPVVTTMGNLSEVMVRGGMAFFMGLQGEGVALGREIEAGLKSAGLPGMGIGSLARDIVSMPDAFMGSPGVAHPAIPLSALPKARSLGIIGEGEAGWKGTKAAEDPKIAQQRYIDAYKEWEDAREAQPPSASGPMPGEGVREPGAVAAAESAEPVAPVAPPDIHETARAIAPDVFNEYDALDTRKETFRRWIGELGELRPQQPRVKELQAEIDNIVGKVKGREDRLTKAAADRLKNARDELNGLLTTDTPDMARIRKDLLDTDIAMREMAPAVSDAYRRAREAMPEEAGTISESSMNVSQYVDDYIAGKGRDDPTYEQFAANHAKEIEAEFQRRKGADEPIPTAPEPLREPTSTAAETPQAPFEPIRAPEVAAQPEVPQKAPETPAARPGPANENIVTDIAGDVRQKLEAAGRPPEEAQAAAAIVDSHYRARAERLNLTPEELYNRDAPDITAAETRRKGATGATTFKDGETTIKLFKDADASTFMHETGHQWLDELMRDAKLDQAVESLKTDAAAVRNWLGAEEGAELTTRQHEKFARGFERYLMEGRAPSKELASVFEQFKKWLTDIYQTVQKLRSPITDEIRGVFDRLIVPESGEPVIAKDRERGPTFADIHEADAKSVKPEDASSAADRIRAESDAIAERLLEDYNALFPERERGEPQAGGRPASAAGVPDRGPETGPAAGETGGAAPTGEVGAGGGEPASQGGGVRTAKREQAGLAPQTVQEKVPEPVSANDPLPRSETQLLDKAGNIRIDNLNVPDDVAAAIRQAADEGNEFIAARRGVMSDAQAIELADALGMSTETLNLRKIGEAFNAEQIWAARKLLVESAGKVRDAMAKAAGGTDADILAYAEAKSRHQMIQEQVAGITAEAGRALRAFRAFEGAKEAEQLGAFLEQSTGRTLFQLRREAQLGMELDTPQKVSKFIHDGKRPTFKDMIIEFWMSALLSGPTTHVKNIIGNMAVAVNKIGETGIAGVIGEARTRIGVGPEDRMYIGEAKAVLFGTLQGSKDGVIAAAKAFVDEDFSTVPSTAERAKYKAIPSAKVNVAGRELEIGGRQVRIPLRALSAEDEFFSAIAHRQELNTLAYREASRLGLEGDAFKQKIADIVMNPSDAQMEAARKAAEYQTFRSPLGPTGRAIQQFSNSHFAAKIVVPFIRTVTNILKYAGERTPFGLLSAEVRDNLIGRNGGAVQDMQYARLIMGSMITTAVIGLTMEGLITGGGPSDPKQRAILRMAGWQPYSLKIGDSYVAYDWLDPFSTIMGLSADLTEGVQEAQANELDLQKGGAMIIGSLAKNLMSKLSLRGASDLIQTVTDPDRYGERYIQNMTGTVVPNVFAQYARAADPVQRDARTLLDGIKARIHGLRETLNPVRDIWGEPVTSEGAVGPDFGSPLRQSTISQDPVNQKLIQLQVWPSKPQRQIRGVELTDQQYDDYTRIGGRLAKMRLDAIVAMPQFNQAPAQIQRDIITKTISNARESAATQIMMANPQIMQTALDDKLRVLHGGQPHKGKLQQPEQ